MEETSIEIIYQNNNIPIEKNKEIVSLYQRIVEHLIQFGHNIGIKINKIEKNEDEVLSI